MTVNLSTLLFRVRSTVAEINTDNLDDMEMFREIQKAGRFVETIRADGVTDTETEIPIVCLAAYYCHLNYTLLNARRLGTIDESVLIRQNELKKIARAMLQTISEQMLTEDLAVDEEKYAKMGPLAISPTTSCLDDYRF